MNVKKLIESKRDQNGNYRSFAFDELLDVSGQDLTVLLPHLFYAKGEPSLCGVSADEVLQLVGLWIDGVDEDGVHYVIHLLSPKFLPYRCKGDAGLLLDKISKLGFSVCVQEAVGGIRELWIA